MIKWPYSALVGAAALTLLATGPSWAAPGGTPGPNPNAPGQQKKFDAPEIDIGAAGAGLSILVIALLLAAERRSRSV